MSRPTPTTTHPATTTTTTTTTPTGPPPPTRRKRGLFDSILCCLSPRTDEQVVTQKPASATAAVAGAGSGNAGRTVKPVATAVAAETPGASTTVEAPTTGTISNGAHRPVEETPLASTGSSTVVHEATADTAVPLGNTTAEASTLAAQTESNAAMRSPGQSPLLQQGVLQNIAVPMPIVPAGVTPLAASQLGSIPVATSTTMEPADEEKEALARDEPLLPSSNAIVATVPVTTDGGALTVVESADELSLRGGEGEAIQWLLPPLTEPFKRKKCLVLDLDETLVHSSFKIIYHADFVIPVEIDSLYHSVHVIKRPGVDEFMRKMGEIYEIVVFTASLAKYADPVLDKLDIHNVVTHRLFRESCLNHMGNYVKDLSQLGRDLKDVIIIDNSPASYVFHPAHAVPISSWFNDVHDTELLDLIPFLNDLAEVEDVSAVLQLSI